MIFQILLIAILTISKMDKTLAIFVRDSTVVNNREVRRISDALHSKGYSFHCFDSSFTKPNHDALIHFLDEMDDNYDKILLTFDGHGSPNGIVGFRVSHMERIIATIEGKSNKQFYIFHSCRSGSFVKKFLDKISQNAVIATSTGLDNIKTYEPKSRGGAVVEQFLTGVWKKTLMPVLIHAYFGENPLSNPSFSHFERLQSLPKEDITLKDVSAGLGRTGKKEYHSKLVGRDEPALMSQIEFIRGGETPALEWGMIPIRFIAHLSKHTFQSTE